MRILLAVFSTAWLMCVNAKRFTTHSNTEK